MLIDSFLTSALIIDDKAEEIDKLKQLLEERDIWVRHFTPEVLLRDLPVLRNRKIIFLDLYIDESKRGISNQVSLIRRILKNCIGLNFGTYGIILWTKHTDEVHEFKKRIKLDLKDYNLPLFIVPLDKTKYLQADNFETIFEDIDNTLQNNTAANFFINWDKMVSKGKDTSITNVYSLINDFDKQDDNLKFLLFKLAKNYTGVPDEQVEAYPLHVDAFKAFNDLLLDDANSQKVEIENFLNNHNNISYISISQTDKEYKKDLLQRYFINGEEVKKEGKNVNMLEKLDLEMQEIYANLNWKMLLDNTNLVTDNILPGNIYKIIGQSPFKLDDADLFQDATPVLIELTPPCDFANNKMKKPRCIGGFFGNYSKNRKLSFGKDYHYNEIYPIKLPGISKCQLIIFDFRYFGSISNQELKKPAGIPTNFSSKG